MKANKYWEDLSQLIFNKPLKDISRKELTVLVERNKRRLRIKLDDLPDKGNVQ